jgi:hypothetical protein
MTVSQSYPQDVVLYPGDWSFGLPWSRVKGKMMQVKIVRIRKGQKSTQFMLDCGKLKELEVDPGIL